MSCTGVLVVYAIRTMNKCESRSRNVYRLESGLTVLRSRSYLLGCIGQDIVRLCSVRHLSRSADEIPTGLHNRCSRDAYK